MKGGRNGGDRQRPGRLRQWLVRSAVWGLAVVTVCVALLVVVAQSAWFGDRLGGWAERQLTERLGRPVEIGAVSVRLLPLAVEASDVVVAGAAAGDAPLAVAELVLLEGEITGLGERGIRLRRALVRRPEVRIELYDSGDSNLVRWRRRGEPGSSRLARRLEIGLLEVEDGALRVDDLRLPLTLTAREVAASLVGGEGLSATGRLEAEEVEAVLPGAVPYSGSVAATVKVERGRAELLRSRFDGPRLAASATGSWSWRGEKELRLEIVAGGQAAVLDRLGYGNGLLGGSFEYAGELSWTPASWEHRGTMTSPALRVLDRTLTDAVVALTGDRDVLLARIERGAYGGGQVIGTVDWRVRQPERPVELDLELSGVDLERLAVDQGVPVHRIGGRVSGPFRYRFVPAAPRSGDGTAELAVAPAESGAADSLPLSGHAPLAIRDGVLEAGELRLAGPGLDLAAAGSYDLESAAGSFDFELSTGDIADLLALTPLLEGLEEPQLWRPLSGAGELAGTLHLSPEAVESDLRITLAAVEAPGYSAEWVEGSFRLTPEGAGDIRVEMSRPEGRLGVSGAVPFDEAGQLALAVDLAGWPLADLRAWLPIDLPADGLLFGSVELTGAVETPRGRLAASVRPVAVAGIELSEAELDVAFGPERVEIGRAALLSPAGRVELSGRAGVPDDVIELDLTSSSLDLAASPFDAVGRGRLGGSLTLRGDLRGSLERPRLALDVEWRDLRLAGEPLPVESDSTRLRWDGSQLELTGGLAGILELDGGGRLDAEGADLSVALAGDLAALTRLASTRPLPDFAGELAGTASFKGEHREGPTLELELNELEARHAQLSLRNLEPVALRVGSEEITIDSLYLADAAGTSELFVSGEVGVSEPSLDLRVLAAIDPEWLELLLPGVDIRGGTFDAIGAVTGTPDGPRLNGLGELRGASALSDALPSSVEELSGTLLFYPDRVVLDSVTAQSAGGTLMASGHADLPTAERELSYRLQVNGAGLNVRYPEGWLLRAGTELSLASTESGRLLQGSVVLDRAFYLEPVEVGVASLLQSLFERQRVEVAETDELLAATQINLEVRGSHALRINNNLARLEGDVDLALRGTLADPVVFGEVRLAPGGTLVYSGNEYRVRRGLLTFANPYRIEPVIDLVAEADLREYEVALNLSGRPERLNASFSSDPPLADLEILSLLTGSTPAPEVSPDRDLAAADAGAEGFLYGQATALVSERVNRLFGLDKLRIDPLTSSTGDLSSARVTVGKRLSRDLFATYSYDPSTTEQQILELEWSVNRSLVLVLTQNGDDTYALDARWEKAF